MRDIILALRRSLSQLDSLLVALDNEQYCSNVPVLSNNSIGQHTRHILEFFIALEAGYDNGIVNYDARKRDRTIATDKEHAVRLIRATAENLERWNKDLRLEVSQSIGQTLPFLVDTNYERELVFNLEHVIHHMALIRIGVGMVSTIVLDEGFGVAASTIRHRNGNMRVNATALKTGY